MTKKDKAITYIGLALLIAIGGIVMYGKKEVKSPQPTNIITAPLVKGPTAPPPGYKN